MSKRELKKREQRAALIKHGWLCFAARGYDDTQVIDIARSAGIAHGTLYRHFENKEDLYNTVCETMVDEVLSAIPDVEDLEALTRGALKALNDAGYFAPAREEAERLRAALEDRAAALVGDRRARLWRAMLLEVALDDDEAFVALIAAAFPVQKPRGAPVKESQSGDQTPVKSARASGWR